MNKVASGVLSTANIDMARVIPAMQQSALCSIDAIFRSEKSGQWERP